MKLNEMNVVITGANGGVATVLMDYFLVVLLMWLVLFGNFLKMSTIIIILQSLKWTH